MLGLGHVAGEAERTDENQGWSRSIMPSIWGFILLAMGSVVHLGEGILIARAEDVV